MQRRCKTLHDLYRFTRLVEGSKQAPALLQAIIVRVIAGLENVYNYLDGIIIGTTDRSTHLRMLRIVMARLLKFGFWMNSDKCTWMKYSVRLLRFHVGILVQYNGLANINTLRVFDTQYPISAGFRSFVKVTDFIAGYDELAPSSYVCKAALRTTGGGAIAVSGGSFTNRCVTSSGVRCYECYGKNSGSYIVNHANGSPYCAGESSCF
jgi:Reverse transcriptase (RNA-dependent DNA polymerase)